MDYALHDYDRYIVCFSGGKDSTATFLYLLEHGIPRSRIELWHQDIDGCEDSLFDWPITRDYCRRFAAAFGVPLYLQWKVGGFRQELLRTNARTAPRTILMPRRKLQLLRRHTELPRHPAAIPPAVGISHDPLVQLLSQNQHLCRSNHPSGAISQQPDTRSFRRAW